MFGDAFADDDGGTAGADPGDPNAAPGSRKGGLVGRLPASMAKNIDKLLDEKMEKLEKKLKHLADMLGSTMSKADRKKLMAGLAVADEDGGKRRDGSMDGDQSSHVASDDDALSAGANAAERQSIKGMVNNQIQDMKAQQNQEVLGIWAAIKKLDQEKMDRSLCENALSKLKRKVEEGLGSLSASSDEGGVTPGGTIMAKKEQADGSKKRREQGKASDRRTGAGEASYELQQNLDGIDLGALKEMTRQFPAMQKLLDELAQHGGYAIISLMKEQIQEL